MPDSVTLRIGYVPEHFSTPLHFAKVHFKLSGTLIPFPSGTGQMITAIENDELDIGIGLTEGWIAHLGRATSHPSPSNIRLVGTYVETPLCWAISTGRDRDIHNVSELKGKNAGVSRIGSGSHIMSFVLADQQGWLPPPAERSQSGREGPSWPEPFSFVPLHAFANLRAGVNDSTADFFMWEHFTSKRYHDNGSIKRVGEIYTPWPSWMITVQKQYLKQTEGQIALNEFLTKLDMGIGYFNAHQDEAVKYISTELDYSKEDAQEWLGTVRFANGVKGVSKEIVEKTIEVLKKGGTLGSDRNHEAKWMIGIEKK